VGKDTNNLEGSRSEDVKDTLQKLDIHQKWSELYLNSEHERFYELVTDRIVQTLDAAPESLILDAGCGTCAHSVRFAKRGFRCYAVDFSQEILKEAETYVREQRLQERVTIKCEDITSLSFESNSFDYILCWGVLMHIPDLKKAVAELCRVLKPNGKIVISEVNMHSLQATLTYIVRKLMRTKYQIAMTPSGMEYWMKTSAGLLLARKANISNLINILRENDVIVKRRWPGGFTELYIWLPHPILRKPIHAWNEFWFRFIRLPQLAFGNILYGEKQGPR
jgi:2-polyprenyl-3-methyl-5-hydroxy-6-metoxy-1,4-benzoquinol methylase